MGQTTTQFDVHYATLRAFNWRNLQRLDWLMLLLVVCLACAGWATLYSASFTSSVSYFQKQIAYFFAGLALAAFIVCIDYRLLVSLGPLAYLAVLVMLGAVLAMGDIHKGSERWLSLGPLNLQPSEFSKLALVYMLAWYLNWVGPAIRKLHWFGLTFVIAGVPMILILKQPNLGTAATLAPVVVAMLFVAGCRVWHLGVLMAAGLMLGPYVWFEMKDFEPSPPAYQEATHAGKIALRDKMRDAYEAQRKPYDLHWHQKMRIYGFLHPESDKKASGWQTYQSMITVGSGGLSGKGFLKSTQTRLKYLPEYHTDFIFSLLAEERGFIGAAVLIGLFAAFLLRGISFARDCPDMTGTLLATGVTAILAFHVFVNIGITAGLLPVTGIPLPFLSYGGSFYLTTMASVGILLNIPMRRQMFVN